MTEEQNIKHLRNDIVLLLTNTFNTRIKQIAINNPDIKTNLLGQFENFIRRLDKKINKIFFKIKLGYAKEINVTGNTDNFRFDYTVYEDNSSSFTIDYIQKTKREFEISYLTKRVKESSYGYVYLLKSKYGYKIGCTMKLSERMNHFGVLLPFKYIVDSIIKTKEYTQLERTLHKLLSHKRLNGEWFKLTKQDLKEIDVVLANMKLTRDPYSEL